MQPIKMRHSGVTFCSKCGAPGRLYIGKRYHASIQKDICRIEGEHIECTCTTCGYIWAELTFDSTFLGTDNDTAK